MIVLRCTRKLAARLTLTPGAEVFAAVHPLNNGKLKKDLAKLARSSAPHRYVFFRSPQVPPSERIENGIHVVALPEYGR